VRTRPGSVLEPGHDKPVVGGNHETSQRIADALFKDGKAAMIINGDWSWSGYKKAGIDIGVAPLPKIKRTGLWCAPMVSPKGFSVNVNVSKEKLPLVIEFLKFIMEPENQLVTAKALNTMPTRTILYEDPFIKNDDILINSKKQIEFGKPMPVVQPNFEASWQSKALPPCRCPNLLAA
jgi:maltose-binding protein MalE